MILVTGANGKIGKHLVRALLKKGEKVKVLVRKKNSLPKRKNLIVCRGDITDKKCLKKAVKGVDTIYHLAAIVDYEVPNKELYKVNVDGTKNLLKAAGKRKFIYMSSTAVMGLKLSKLPADEYTSCRPTNFYGQTKLKAEKLALKCKAIIIRATDIYGPGFGEGYLTVVDKLKRKRMPIIGSGKNRIQYLHINDLIQALLLAKDHGKKGEIYIIAGDDVKTQEELFSLICKYLRIKPPKQKVSKEIARFLARVHTIKSKVRKKAPRFVPEYVNKISSDRIFNTSKAKEDLGFESKVKYEEGLKELVKRFRSRAGRKGTLK